MLHLLFTSATLIESCLHWSLTRQAGSTTARASTDCTVSTYQTNGGSNAAADEIPPPESQTLVMSAVSIALAADLNLQTNVWGQKQLRITRNAELESAIFFFFFAELRSVRARASVPETRRERTRRQRRRGRRGAREPARWRGTTPPPFFQLLASSRVADADCRDDDAWLLSVLRAAGWRGGAGVAREDKAGRNRRLPACATRCRSRAASSAPECLHRFRRWQDASEYPTVSSNVAAASRLLQNRDERTGGAVRETWQCHGICLFELKRRKHVIWISDHYQFLLQHQTQVHKREGDREADRQRLTHIQEFIITSYRLGIQVQMHKHATLQGPANTMGVNFDCYVACGLWPCGSCCCTSSIAFRHSAGMIWHLLCPKMATSSRVRLVLPPLHIAGPVAVPWPILGSLRYWLHPSLPLGWSLNDFPVYK